MTYQLTSTTAILRNADNATIPADPGNADYIAYQAWVATGNTPTPAPAPAPAPPLTATPYQFKAALVQIGLYSAAAAAVAAADQLTQLAWAEAQVFSQSDPHITAIGTALGQGPTQITELFQLAQTLAP